MDLKQLVVLALQVSIVGTVLGLGLEATADDLLYLVRRPTLLAKSLLAMLVIMPLVAVLMVRVFDLRHVTAATILALAISPVPPLLPNRERTAAGNRLYALSLMATLALLSIVTVPLWVEALERLSGRPLEVTAGPIAKVVLVAVVAPLVVGVSIRALSAPWADRLERVVAPAAKILLLLAVAALLAVAWRLIWDAIGGGAVAAIVVFVAVGLLVGEVLGRPDPHRSAVLGLSSACRHPAIALAIASANFPDEQFAGTILLYLLVNLIVGAPFVKWHRRIAAASLVPRNG